MSAEELLRGLDEQQRLAAETLLGPVALLAGAGTGKTRAITHRIAYGVATGVYAPGRVMALTFTARAASELRGRLRSLGVAGVTARTFHASALAQLSSFWPEVVGGQMPRIVEGKARVIADAAQALKLRLDTATLRDVAAEIEWRKTSRLTIEEYAARGRTMPQGLGASAMLDLQAEYEKVKDDRRRLDFEDVLLAAAGMLEIEPRVAHQVREQYRFFVVDEYQDVSPLQHDLLSLWLGDRNDVCVVGDVSQTIYTFAGATPDFLLGFASEHEDAVQLRLESNYRSTPAIVGAANRLMRGHAGALELRAVESQPGEAPIVRMLEDDHAEATAIATSVAAEIAEGREPESIAILYRINSQSALIEAALDVAGVPFVVRGATRFFDQKEVAEALLLLRGASVASAGEPLVPTVRNVLSSIGYSPVQPTARGAIRDRWEALSALLRMAEEAPEGTTLRAFVDELLARQTAQHEPTLRAVTLATLHSAKGLEWDSVHLAGLVEGLLPISYARTPENIDEERRLLYVGVTRARQRLEITWAERQQRGRGSARPASRFLAELG